MRALRTVRFSTATSSAVTLIPLGRWNWPSITTRFRSRPRMVSDGTVTLTSSR